MTRFGRFIDYINITLNSQLAAFLERYIGVGEQLEILIDRNHTAAGDLYADVADRELEVSRIQIDRSHGKGHGVDLRLGFFIQTAYELIILIIVILDRNAAVQSEERAVGADKLQRGRLRRAGDRQRAEYPFVRAGFQPHFCFNILYVILREYKRIIVDEIDRVGAAGMIRDLEHLINGRTGSTLDRGLGVLIGRRSADDEAPRVQGAALFDIDLCVIL